jgi:hypothetical protein
MSHCARRHSTAFRLKGRPRSWYIWRRVDSMRSPNVHRAWLVAYRKLQFPCNHGERRSGMASRLAEFKIEGLFGLYTHKIALNSQERITIIIGPNGRGKTVCLNFIEALFHKRFSYFKDIPFQTAEFAFNGGETIRLERAQEPKPGHSERASARNLKFTMPGQAPRGSGLAARCSAARF